MTPEEMKERTLQLGLRVIAVVEALPRRRASDVVGKQLLKAGTSVVRQLPRILPVAV